MQMQSYPMARSESASPNLLPDAQRYFVMLEPVRQLTEALQATAVAEASARARASDGTVATALSRVEA